MTCSSVAVAGSQQCIGDARGWFGGGRRRRGELGEEKNKEESKFKGQDKGSVQRVFKARLEAKSVDGRAKSSVVCDAEQKSRFEFPGKTDAKLSVLSLPPTEPLSALLGSRRPSPL